MFNGGTSHRTFIALPSLSHLSHLLALGSEGLYVLATYQIPSNLMLGLYILSSPPRLPASSGTGYARPHRTSIALKKGVSPTLVYVCLCVLDEQST